MHPGRPRPCDLPPLTERLGPYGDARVTAICRAAATSSLRRSGLRHGALHLMASAPIAALCLSEGPSH